LLACLNQVLLGSLKSLKLGHVVSGGVGRFNLLGLKVLLILELGEHSIKLLLILRSARAHRWMLLNKLILLEVLSELSMLRLGLLVLVHGVVEGFHILFRLLHLGSLQAHPDIVSLLLERCVVGLLFGLLTDVYLGLEVLRSSGLGVVVLWWLDLLLRRRLIWSVHLHLPEVFVVFLNLVRILIWWVHFFNLVF
jgi:hypothetical protein